MIYNIHFHGHVLWYLKLMFEYSVRRGRAADWDDPAWSMLGQGGYGDGARWHLSIAVQHNDLELAEWVPRARSKCEPASRGREDVAAADDARRGDAPR